MSRPPTISKTQKSRCVSKRCTAAQRKGKLNTMAGRDIIVTNIPSAPSDFAIAKKYDIKYKMVKKIIALKNIALFI